MQSCLYPGKRIAPLV